MFRKCFYKAFFFHFCCLFKENKTTSNKICISYWWLYCSGRLQLWHLFDLCQVYKLCKYRVGIICNYDKAPIFVYYITSNIYTEVKKWSDIIIKNCFLCVDFYTLSLLPPSSFKPYDYRLRVTDSWNHQYTCVT